MAVDSADVDVITRQLGRQPRGVLDIVFRTVDGIPAVIKTHPILPPDGTPFPTLYYLTEPRLVTAASRLESVGVMRLMNKLLVQDPDLAQQYRQAHTMYLAERNSIADLGIDFSGGGMPDRVKCLHVLIAHSLAKGPGVNPMGDYAVALIATSLIDVIDSTNWPVASEDLYASNSQRPIL